MRVLPILLFCELGACLYNSTDETNSSSSAHRHPRSIAIPIKLGQVLLGLFTAKNLSKGVIYSIAKAVGLIAEGPDLSTDKMNEILKQYEDRNNLSIERNQMLKRQTEVIEEGFKKVTKTIHDSTREILDSLNEKQYKEMLLLIEKYTRNLTISGNFKKNSKRARRRIEKRMQRWYEMDSGKQETTIDFNYNLFIRSARLWQDHVFKSPSLQFDQVQRQMVMFVTVYSLINKSSFGFIPTNLRDEEWQGFREDKVDFLTTTLVIILG